VYNVHFVYFIPKMTNLHRFAQVYIF